MTLFMPKPKTKELFTKDQRNIIYLFIYLRNSARQVHASMCEQ
jgi:hypothetical protein